MTVAIEGVSAFGKWKMSSAALWIRWRQEHGLCGSCGEHPLGTVCVRLGVVYEEPSWVAEILEHYGAERQEPKASENFNQKWCDLVHRGVLPPAEPFVIDLSDPAQTGGKHWLTHDETGKRKITRASPRRELPKST